MKKTVIILILVFTGCFISSGIAQFQIGPLVGGNLSGVNIDPDVQGRNINYVTRFTAGVAITYNFSSMFAVQLEPAYTQRGASIYSAETDFGLILEIDQGIEMSYIDIPVLFKVSFDAQFIKPYVLAGGNIGFPLQDTKLTIDKVIANGQDVIYLLPADLIEQELKNESTDYGLNFGAGVSFPLGFIDMFIQAQYNLGLSDLNDEPAIEGVEKDVIKNRGIQVKTGLLITL
jgi:opacity protein-like surface antigen